MKSKKIYSIMIKIKFPSKKTEKEIKNFFIKKGLGFLISKKVYYVDGYKVTEKDYLNKKKDKLGKFDIRITKNAHPPEIKDLYRLYQFIILNKRTTVLEFGCGHSSAVIAKALEYNKSKYKQKPYTRCIYPYQLFIVDNEKKYLNHTKKKIIKNAKKAKVNYFFSDVQMTSYNGSFACEYKRLPQVNPDFIYLDAPSQFSVKKKVNNFTIAKRDMMPMSCDILKFENFLVPGTIILIDGRSINARYLKNSFKRNWKYYFDSNSDQTVFVLDEKPLGPFNKEQLSFYNKK